MSYLEYPISGLMKGMGNFTVGTFIHKQTRGKNELIQYSVLYFKHKQ
jgi:hypothetical protein